MITPDSILNQDCVQGMASLPDACVDLVVVDPPYYINYAGHDWDKTDDFTSSTEAWVKECFRLLKPNGSMWSFMGYENIIPFISLLSKHGHVQMQNWSIWAHGKGRGSKQNLKSLREDIVHITKSDNYVWNPLQVMREVIAPYVKDGRPRGWILDQETGKRIRWTGCGNVFWYSAPQWNSKAEKQVHPAQKPIMLMQRLILMSSNENDVVLDPFCGSGTTPIACLTTGRQYVCFENDSKWFHYATERIAKFAPKDYPEYNLWNDKRIAEFVQQNDAKEKQKKIVAKTDHALYD